MESLSVGTSSIRDADLGVEPLERNISGVPGEQGIYIDEGNVTNGVRPDRVYYYVLAPIDHVGNENLIATHPVKNTVRVDVENEFGHTTNIDPRPATASGTPTRHGVPQGVG